MKIYRDPFRTKIWHFLQRGVLQLHQLQVGLAGPFQKLPHLAGAAYGRTDQSGHNGCTLKAWWLWHLLVRDCLQFKERLKCFRNWKSLTAPIAHKLSPTSSAEIWHFDSANFVLCFFFCGRFLPCLWTRASKAKVWAGRGRGGRRCIQLLGLGRLFGRLGENVWGFLRIVFF